MLFSNTKIDFSEPNYVTVHTIMNIVTATMPKWRGKYRNNILKVLLLGTFSRRDITSTQ